MAQKYDYGDAYSLAKSLIEDLVSLKLFIFLWSAALIV